MVEAAFLIVQGNVDKMLNKLKIKSSKTSKKRRKETGLVVGDSKITTLRNQQLYD
jgi:hypothetical protein